MTNHSFESDPNIDKMRAELATRPTRKHISVKSPELREWALSDNFTLAYKRTYDDKTTDTVFRTIYVDNNDSILTEQQNIFKDKLKTLFAFDSKGTQKAAKYHTPKDNVTGEFDTTYQLVEAGSTWWLLVNGNVLVPWSNSKKETTKNGAEYIKYTFSIRQPKSIITEEYIDDKLNKLLGPILNKTVK